MDVGIKKGEKAEKVSCVVSAEVEAIGVEGGVPANAKGAAPDAFCESCAADFRILLVIPTDFTLGSGRSSNSSANLTTTSRVSNPKPPFNFARKIKYLFLKQVKSRHIR